MGVTAVASASGSSTSEDEMFSSPPRQQEQPQRPLLGDFKLGFVERAVSATGAAVFASILVTPLDVAKTRLQAQAAGVSYSDLRCSPPTCRVGTNSVCPSDRFHYKGTLDVFYKIIRQEGAKRLWRGTNAGLALAVPTVGIYLPCYDIFRNWIEELTTRDALHLTPYAPLVAGSMGRTLACISCYPIELARTRMQAFKEVKAGVKPPEVWRTLTAIRGTNNLPGLQNYRLLWTGVGAQLARDVPFSAICWSALEPIRRRLLGMVGEEANVATTVGANFSAGFVAGTLAATLTCPFDVAKTRRQIERDPARASHMTTGKTLTKVWRDGGMKGLFTGLAPRVFRVGPSVGIVVSFYEVVKHALHQRQTSL